jgi:ribosomal subunit interface protein
MQVHISGRHVDLGDAFRAHVEKRLQENVTKYIDRVTDIDVVVGKEASRFIVNIHGNTGTHSGIVMKSQGAANDVYAAFDEASTRIEKQLRRYKRRLKDHHHSEKASVVFALGKKYVLQQEHHQEELSDEGAPVVVAEKPTPIQRLSVREAVMKMDLADLPALMFVNAANGRMNVIYRRVDGHISWVDPEEAAA